MSAHAKNTLGLRRRIASLLARNGQSSFKSNIGGRSEPDSDRVAKATKEKISKRGWIVNAVEDRRMTNSSRSSARGHSDRHLFIFFYFLFLKGGLYRMNVSQARILLLRTYIHLMMYRDLSPERKR